MKSDDSFQTRRELQEAWRERLALARAEYEAASKAFLEAMREHYDINMTADPSYAITKARRLESAALAKYRRVLRTFTDLLLHGKNPDTPKNR